MKRSTPAAALLAAAALAAAAPAAACPVIDSRGWVAWIDQAPGVDARRTLHVVGELDLPTPGYEIVWTVGPADRRLPPAQMLILDATPPGGMSLQVVDTREVLFRTDAVYPEYREIRIVCGDETLAVITDIEIAN